MSGYSTGTSTPTGNGPQTSLPRPLKILMLHGYTQSGPLFHAKTRALENLFQKAFSSPLSPASSSVIFSFPTAPMRLSPSQVPGFVPTSGDAAEDDKELEAYGWWRKNDDTGEYVGIEAGLESVAKVLREEGPFDGVVGFSQGAALAGMLASLLEGGSVRREAWKKREETKGGIPYPKSFLVSFWEKEGGGGEVDEAGELIHPPLKFAMSYSGFIAPSPMYASFYDPPIRTEMLHFIGSLDSVVEESRVLKLVDACGYEDEQERQKHIVYHPGGHFIPSGKAFLNIAIGFVRERVVEQSY